MFKKNETTDFNDAETVIGSSVNVEGDFTGQGNLVVEGTIKGSVKTTGNLRVGERAKITAAVEAKNALISGEIKGNITASGDIELTAGANVTGDISAQSVSIARGARLNGHCTMTNEQTAKTPGKTEAHPNNKDVFSAEI